MKSRIRSRTTGMVRVGALGLSALLMAGCAAGPGTGKMPGLDNSSAPPPASVTTRPAPNGGSTAAPSPSDDLALTAPDSPSAPAKMVCGEETRNNIARILALASPPLTTDSWADKLYTCTYALPTGPLVLSVKEAADTAAARAYFERQQQSSAQAAPIEGLANLGLPAFQTPASAVFVKDSFVLTVDASALPATVGPQQVSRGAFAYQIATTVLACWSE